MDRWRDSLDAAMARFRALPFGARVVFVAAIAALLFHLAVHPLDGIAVILLVLAISPWLVALVERFRIGEIEVSLRDKLELVEERQVRQQVEIDAATRFLITNFLGEYELLQLERFGQSGAYVVDPGASFERELGRLIDLGLVRRRPARGFRTLRRTPEDDVREHFEITDSGRRFLEIRRALLRESEREEPAR